MKMKSGRMASNPFGKGKGSGKKNSGKFSGSKMKKAEKMTKSGGGKFKYAS